MSKFSCYLRPQQKWLLLRQLVIGVVIVLKFFYESLVKRDKTIKATKFRDGEKDLPKLNSFNFL